MIKGENEKRITKKIEESNNLRPNISLKEAVTIEAILVFIIVVFTILISVWKNIVVSEISKFNFKLLLDILKNAGIYTITFVVGYSIAKRIYYYIHQTIETTLSFLKNLKFNKKQIYVFHTYLISSLIIAFTPIRPIIQFPIFSDTFDIIKAIETDFVYYDFIETIFIISILFLISSFLLFIFNKNIGYKVLIIFFVILALFGGIISLNNLRSNYEAKILESRGLFHLLSEAGSGELSGSIKNRTYFFNVGEQVKNKASEALLVANNKKEEAYALYWIANGYSYMGKQDEALENILKSIKYDPTNYAYGHLSYIYIDLGKYNLAIEAAKTCIKISPESFCYGPLAKARWYMAEYQESIAILKKALELHPKSKSLKETLEFIKDENKRLEKYFNLTEMEAQLRKKNESLNACLADIQENLYHEMFKNFCLIEEKENNCVEISGEHGIELNYEMFLAKNNC